MATVERSESIARLGLTRRSSAILMGCAVVVAMLIAITWSQNHPAPHQTAPGTARPAVTGLVRIEGGPPGTPDGYPLKYAKLVVTGTTAAGDPLVRHLHADAQGRFTLSLPTGRYTVTAIAYGPATRPLSTQPHKTVKVTSGHPLHVRLTGYVL